MDISAQADLSLALALSTVRVELQCLQLPAAAYRSWAGREHLVMPSTTAILGHMLPANDQVRLSARPRWLFNIVKRLGVRRYGR